MGHFGCHCPVTSLSTSSTSGAFAFLHFYNSKRVNLSTAFKESESSITLQLRERILPPCFLQAQLIWAAGSPTLECLRVKAAGITSPGSQCFLNPVLEGGWFLARGRRQWNVPGVGMVMQDSRRRRKLREELVSQRKKLHNLLAEPSEWWRRPSH